MLRSFTLLLVLLLSTSAMLAQKTARAFGIPFGIFSPGPTNAITDVGGVLVGQVTLRSGDSVRTGATAILPHGGNLFQEKVPAAIYLGNGFGKLVGYSQVAELGNIETPIVLTNTLSVPTAAEAIITHTLSMEGNERVRSVNPVVGETNDGRLNDIRGRHLQPDQVLRAIREASADRPAEGNVGAGTGTVCFGWKGGIGSSSRQLPRELGGYRVGVLVQSNFGGVLQVAGVPVGQELGQYSFRSLLEDNPGDGSCMIIVATDAPVDARNLERLAKRAMLGLARTGGYASNGSGDYVIAFSTHIALRIPYSNTDPTLQQEVLPNAAMSPLFLAAVEATEEAIINSLFAAKSERVNGYDIKALPVERVLDLLREYGLLND